MKKTIPAANWVHDTVTVSFNQRTKVLTLHDYPFKLIQQRLYFTPGYEAVSEKPTELWTDEVRAYALGDEGKGKGWAVVRATRDSDEPTWTATTADGWSVVRTDDDLVTAMGQVLANLV